MKEEKKILAKNGLTYRIFAPREISRRWFIEWYREGKRYRHYKGLSKIKDYDDRLLAAKQMIAELEEYHEPALLDQHATILRLLEEA